MSRCLDCEKPVATPEDFDTTPQGEGAHLCWAKFSGYKCKPVDWRARAKQAETERDEHAKRCGLAEAIDTENRLEAALAKVAALEKELAEWAAKDGNSPGYNNEKAKTYGRIAYERGQTITALEAKVKTLREVLEPLRRWPTVYALALAMVRKLDVNKPKKGGREGWQDDDPVDLLRRVREEVAEMDLAPPGDKLLYEAADVANMAMMVADAAGALKLSAALAAAAKEE